MKFFETHCHLNDPEAFPEPNAAIEEAHAARVEKILVVGFDEKSNNLAVEMADSHKNIYASCGYHPNYSKEYRTCCLKKIEDFLSHPKVLALGEIGLDYHWDYATPEEQEFCFRDQLELGLDKKVPMIFHCRDAYSFLLDIISQQASEKYLFHCFSGSKEDAFRASELGAWFGVDGPITFKSADLLREIVKILPRDRLLIETDSPWMSPHPHRGKPNRPSWLPLVNAGLAKTLGISYEECADLTFKNACKFFSIEV